MKGNHQKPVRLTDVRHRACLFSVKIESEKTTKKSIDHDHLHVLIIFYLYSSECWN